MANDKVYARKEGNVVTVFLDANERPVPFSSFDNPPLGFPATMRYSQALAKYGDALVCIERPEAPVKVSTNVVSDERLLRETGTTATRPPAIPSASSGVSALATGAREFSRFMDGGPDPLLEEFKKMVLLHGAATGKKQRELARDIEAVGTFLIAVDRRYHEELVRVRAEAAAPERFKL